MLPLQGLPVTLGTLPQASEVLLPLKHRHQPLLAPLPVKRKNSPQIGNNYQVKVVFPTLNTSCRQQWFCEQQESAECKSHTWSFSEPWWMFELEMNGWGEEALAGLSAHT